MPLSPLKRITHVQPAILAAVLVMSLAVWVGQQLISLMVDTVIPTTAIQAQQIRVKTGQLEAFESTAEAYQQPAPADAVPSDRFGPGPTAD